MAAQLRLQVHPNKAVFIIKETDSPSIHTISNMGTKRLTYKISVTHPDLLLAQPVFGVIEAGNNALVTLTGRFRADPEPLEAYQIQLRYAEATAEMTNDQANLQQQWAAMTSWKKVFIHVGWDYPHPPTAVSAPPTAPTHGPPPPPPDHGHAAVETPPPSNK